MSYKKGIAFYIFCVLIIMPFLFIMICACVFQDSSNKKIKPKENQVKQVEKNYKDKQEEINIDTNDNVSEEETNDDVQNEPPPSTNQVIEQTPPTNNTTQNNNSNSGNNYVAPSTPPVEQTPEPTAPACTPKKFYTTFRADFTSEAECESTYNYYHSIDPNKYLGFICSYQTDDCGDMYYMLTFFDSDSDYFGYNEI